MIYDTFIYFNEKDVVNLRLDLLRPYVDRFIVVEGLRDFRGNNRTPRFLQDVNNVDKVIYIMADIPDYGNDDLAASRRENYLRDCIIEGLDRAKEDDLIFYSDADEIWNPGILPYIASTPAKLEQYLSYYYANYRANYKWYGTTVARRNQFKTIVDLRNRTIRDTPYIQNGGWHMSYCGGIQSMQDKMNAFAHADMVRRYNTKENIQQSIERGMDMFNRGETFTVVPIDETFPHNIKDYPQLIKDYR